MLTGLAGLLQSIATPVAAVALNALWEGALLVVGVWLLLRVWSGVNASTRYLIWSATLVAIVIVPIATTLPFLAQSSPASFPVTKKVVRVAPVTHTLTTAPSASRTAQAPTQSATPALPPRFRVTMPPIAAVAIFALWAVLALIALVRLAIGLMRLEQLKRDALPLPVEYRDAMDRWGVAKKGSRDVRLCVSDEIDVPVAVGLFDAMILIPRSLLERLSASEIDQISLHELAHLRRADDWTNGFQRIAIALLAWNPAALFVSQQLDLEREVACDDWVLSMTGTVRPYALCLTKMAETSTWPRQPMPAPGVFASRKHISMRIERLLGAGRNIATGLSFGPAASAAAIVGALAFVIQMVAPSVAAPCPPTPSTAMAVPQAPKMAVAVPEMKEVRVIVYVTPSASPAVPPRIVHVPAVNVHVPPRTIHVPEVNVHVPEVNVHVPSMDIPIARYDSAMTAAMKTELKANQEMQQRFAHMGKTYAFAYGLHSSSSNTASAVPSCNSCDFSHVDWSGHDMRNVHYVGVDLSDSRLEGTNFSGGTFNGVDFTHSRLTGASFRNAALTGCDFSNADLTGVDFTGAKMSGCQFTHARLTSSLLRDILNSCSGCDFTNADLSGLKLSGIRATGDDFTGANLGGVDFSGAYLTGIDFSNANLEGANLKGATLRSCDLSGANMTGVDVSRTSFIGTDFSERQSPP
ncbi:MAG: pentapeptide repeat-containing protein [Candidatus Eremiobacteraeota bacterium]|nr:pentapeptide repeat-containing protein [Candidatus Eremiobacteraeota bacterium]